MTFISPEAYYKWLQTKSIDEIQRKIKSGRTNIYRIKRNIEKQPVFCKPDLNSQLDMERTYLDLAIKALNEAGGEFVPSSLELKSAAFESIIENISQITLDILDSKEGKSFYIYKVIDNVNDERCGILEEIRSFYIGEWKSKYASSSPCFESKTINWKVNIFYNNGLNVKKFKGKDAFPWKFDEFCHFMGHDKSYIYNIERVWV